MHIFTVYRRFPRVSSTADKENAGLLSTAQFARWVKFGYCYRQHISEFRLLSKRVRTGLLSSAHFQNLKNPFHFSPPTIAQQKYFLRQFMLWITTVVPCCYPQHNSKLPVCPPQNLSPPRVIVIQRTFCRIAPILCPSRVVIPRILLFRAQICSYSRHNALVIPRTFRLLSAAQLYLISK